MDSLPQANFSIKLWPPNWTTRQLLVARMTRNLSTESIFSEKYGLMSEKEASERAKQIEETCFAAANKHFENKPDDGGSAVRLYAEGTSKYMLEALKQGPEAKNSETVFDISGGRRDLIDGEEAAELLKPLTKEGNSYTKICFSNKSFSVNAARVAEPILASLKGQLVDVDLSDCIAGRPEEEALEVMRIFSSALEGCLLRSLNLSNNALGEKGIRACGALLASQNRLEQLYLMSDGISEEAAKAVSKLVPSTNKLKILHFHNNMTGDKGALAISEILKCSPALEDFRCSSSRVDLEGGIALAEALRTCTHLKRLDLCDNMFGVDAGRVLGRTLEQLNGITEVYLNYLNLEDEGFLAIINALKESAPYLEVLEIAGNDISAKAAPALATCISKKQLLTKLNLAENELEDEGAVLISKALEEGHMKLKELNLSWNMIKRFGARCLAQSIVLKPMFQLLNINGNAISREGVAEVKEILKVSEKFVDVLGPLDENDAEEEGEEEGEEEADGEEVPAEGDEELESKLQHLKVDQ